MTATVHWIAADWGTSNLRVWAMGADDTPLHAAESPDGMAALAREDFEPALLAMIGGWLDTTRVTPVIACGMVGSRQGWIEAGYTQVPCPPRSSDRPLARARAADARIAVHVLRGLAQDKPADVMRGEETQLAGLLEREPDFDGVACLPGTHSKWAHVSAGEVVSFQSFLTGELFDLLARTSVLRHSVAAEGWSDEDFEQAVDDAMARPERAAAQLFRLRAEHLLHGADPARARARLSGLLIGSELAGARPYWLGRDVVVIGAPSLAAAYARALALSGLKARTLDGTAMTLAGLAAAQRQLLTERAAR